MTLWLMNPILHLELFMEHGFYLWMPTGGQRYSDHVDFAIQ